MLPFKALPIINNGINFENLASGKYSVKLADINGCELTIPVNIPFTEKLSTIDFASLPKEVCKGQEVSLKVNNPNQKLEWYLDGALLPTASTADFKFSKDLQELSTAKTGKYTVIAKNVSGCEVKGEYTLINNKNALKADFLIPTQAFVGDTVVCLDITKPVPDRVEWTLPGDAFEISSNNSKNVSAFVNQGNYTIQMKAFLGECENTVKHEIQINGAKKPTDAIEEDVNAEMVKSIKVFPNPNDGNFKINIETASTDEISLSLVKNLTGEAVYKTVKAGQTKYELNLNLSLQNGLYILIVKAKDIQKQIRIMVNN